MDTVEDMGELVEHSSRDSFRILVVFEEVHAEDVDLKAVLRRCKGGGTAAAYLETSHEEEHFREI